MSHSLGTDGVGATFHVRYVGIAEEGVEGLCLYYIIGEKASNIDYNAMNISYQR